MEKLKKPLFFTLIVLFVINVAFGFKYKIIYVQGASMDPTYKNSELIVVERMRSLGENWAPDRYDVIVAKEKDGASSLCKRVIGVCGDKIEIENGYIHLNNRELKDPFMGHQWNDGRIGYFMVDDFDQVIDIKWEGMAEITVPEGYVWVIGDNRGYSWFGLLPIENIEYLVIL